MIENPSHFPLFVDLRNKKCVVVGGGTVAARRVAVLCRFGAEVTVVAPRWMGSAEGICWLQREYQHGDLAGATLAVAATDSRAVNRQVGEEAGTLGIPVTVADCRGECTFFFPAMCEGGGVTAGLISREGTDHHRAAKAAKAVRRALEELD